MPHENTQPHDNLFRTTFTTPEAQQDLVQLALPGRITRRFRLETLRAAAGNVQGDTGKEIVAPGQVDLLLSVETESGSRELIYILVEHKSYPDRRVAVQLLRYVAGLWHQWQTTPLPVIHPVVVYCGRTRWTIPRDIKHLHAHVDNGTTVPVNLQYHLLDLSQVTVQKLHQATRLRAYTGLLTFKHVMERLPNQYLRDLLITTLDRELPLQFRRTIWNYILTQVPAEATGETLQMFDEISYNYPGGDEMKSVADVLRERGMEEGLQKGRAALLARQLSRRFTLSEAEEELVRNCRNTDRIEAAADLLLEPTATKGQIIDILSTKNDRSVVE